MAPISSQIIGLVAAATLSVFPKYESQAAAAEPRAKPPTATAPQKKPKILLDAWYTIKAFGKHPYAFYNDRAEERDGKVFFQNMMWKSEEGYINEEQLGEFALPDENLTPLFFHFHSAYRSTELNVDGTVVDGKSFTAKVRKGTQELPAIRRSIPNGTIFAGFFPVWMQKHAQQIKLGENRLFRAIVEDDFQGSFSIKPGRLYATKPDEYARKSGTRLYTLEFRDMKTRWWLDSQGVMVRAEMPEQHLLVERVSGEAEARKFLGEAKE